ncbi:MAG: acyl-CoA thioesterase II [Hyphomicrobiaceae bacterium]|nr:acyl-CoA thioesterase II [Hyphomicrobiaceae bacterium]MCC0009373.1 acyl-CoA thioesterase II [Hyphomicrobiaceae bacterium]
MSALKSVLQILDIEQLDDSLFRGTSPQDGWQRVYGGQVLGQALMAAIRMVPPTRIAHSLHGYFLIGGDPRHPILYEVERTRDGGSFSTRRVKAIQHGRMIFVMGVSFHDPEPGLEHSAQMPDVPAPEDLRSANEVFAALLDKLPENMRAYWSRERPIDMRPVDLTRYMKREAREPAQYIWLKPNGTLPDAPAVHQSMLAYASDFTLLDTALIAHGKVLFDPDMQLASLDHALWIHRPFRWDDWILYAQDSPSGSGSRGFCRGALYSRDGKLIASTAQEGLMRQRMTSDLVK